jgi:hypothetical protein
MLTGSHPVVRYQFKAGAVSQGAKLRQFTQVNNKINGGLPVGSGTLTVFDLDPKSLDFCREI